LVGYLNSVNITATHTQEIVMKNVIKTHAQMPKFIAAAGFVALACTAIGGKALALEVTASRPAAHSTTVSYPVRFSDLDVSKMPGAKTLHLRIRYAAETLCESAATWGKKEGEACVRKAVDDAVARANLPLLSQYSQLRSKGDKTSPVQLAKVN
jgi:UrcA family protein